MKTKTIKNTRLINKGILPTIDLTKMRNDPVVLKPGLPIVREDGKNAVMHMLKSEYDDLVKKHGANAFGMQELFVGVLYRSHLHELILHEAA